MATDDPIIGGDTPYMLATPAAFADADEYGDDVQRLANELLLQTLAPPCLKDAAAMLLSLRRQLAEAKEHINALCSTNSDIAREYRGRWQEAEARATNAERRLEEAREGCKRLAEERDAALRTWHEEQSAELTASQQEVARLRRAGAMLANCAYNLAQRDHLTADERRSLDESRKAWDAALSSPHQSTGQGGGV